MATSQLVAIRDQAKRTHQSGRLAESLDLHDQALRLAPQMVGIWVSAGMLAHELGLQQRSLGYFAQAIELDSRCAPAIDAARRICLAAGLLDRARFYSNMARQFSAAPELDLAMALAIPAIARSADDIRHSRRSYERALDALAASRRFERPDCILGAAAFFLAYQGKCDRALQIKAARTWLTAVPSLSMTAPHCTAAAVRRPGKFRVGFISRFFCTHSIFSTSYGLIKEISRANFEVYALRITPSTDDASTAKIRAAADQMLDLDADLYRARQQIAALELDILFYQDIGMEPVSYALACARLAPVQCVSFGHPDTTGIPTIDYFVSSDLYEPPDADSHYSETLFKLHDVPTLAYYYEPVVATPAATRQEFGLPVGKALYLCPQTLYKVHPDFDALIRGILERDPNAIVMFIEGQFQEYSHSLHDRFRCAMPQFEARIGFMPRRDFQSYLRLLTVVDVVLDTVHFNGMNSSLECFAVGTPVVTLPAEFQRGRHTQAMYRKMGISDCIASDAVDYVDISVRLANDREFAANVRAQIIDRHAVLFEDSNVVREFERFFMEALRTVAGTPDCAMGTEHSLAMHAS